MSSLNSRPLLHCLGVVVIHVEFDLEADLEVGPSPPWCGVQPYWQPHNRSSARRLQSMGWRADGGLWLLVRGGGLFLSSGTGVRLRGFSLLASTQWVETLADSDRKVEGRGVV